MSMDLGDDNGESGEVNPEVIYNSKDSKVKGKLSKSQVILLADIEASELALANPKRNIIIETARQRVEYSRAEDAYSTKQYVEAVKVRLPVEDRKQLYITRNQEGTV